MLKPKLPGGKPLAPTDVKSEKRRILLMTVALILILGAFGMSWLQSQKYRNAPDPSLPAFEDEIVESVALPEIDVAGVEAAVRDAEEVDRVVLERDALETIGRSVRLLTRRHYEAMEPAELDADTRAAVIADPAAHRAQPFVARGRIDALRSRTAPSGAVEHIGRLELEGGGAVYFLTSEVEEVLTDQAWLRIDGLFLKVFRDEDPEAPGTWIEGPLIVGREARRSYAPVLRVEELDPDILAYVGDDRLTSGNQVDPVSYEMPFEALWHAMTYARDLPADAVDWDAAPELDRGTLLEIVQNGEPFRMQPFRFPVSRLQDARVKRAVENPARLAAYTEGWIGHAAWKNVVHFVAPFENRDLQMRDYVRDTRGFFFRNFVYSSEGRGLQVAPMFVLVSAEKFQPEADPLFTYVGYAIAGIAVFLIGMFAVLLKRDRKRAAHLQEEIVRRRRMRRERRALGGATH
jgi:hypothetical protein